MYDVGLMSVFVIFVSPFRRNQYSSERVEEPHRCETTNFCSWLFVSKVGTKMAQSFLNIIYEELSYVNPQDVHAGTKG